jgi:hypothetical protein
MADISKIKVGETEYDVKDATARTAIANFKSSDIRWGYEKLVDGITPLDPGAVYFYVSPGNPYRWYLVDGITEENVVAAYLFKGADSISDALINVNAIGEYPLIATNQITWTTGNGLFFPKTADQYINNSNLISDRDSIYTCVFGFSGATTGTVMSSGTTLKIDDVPMKFLHQSLFYLGGSDKTTRFVGNAVTYGATYRYAAGTATNTNSKGVLAGDWINYKMYYNGSASTIKTVGTNWITDNSSLTSGRVFTTCSVSTYTMGSMYLTSLAFYNCTLTATQHLQLATQINAL